jgi:hypothetical protein
MELDDQQLKSKEYEVFFSDLFINEDVELK